MSGEISINIMGYDYEIPIRYIIMGIGESGNNLSHLTQIESALEDKESQYSLFVCDYSPFRHDDCKYICRRETIMKEISKSDAILILVNVDVQDDFESACNIARLFNENVSAIFSVCVVCGSCCKEQYKALESLYSSIIDVGEERLLIKPWNLWNTVLKPGLVGIDFVDITYVLSSITRGYYYQFDLLTMCDLPRVIGAFERSLKNNDCIVDSKNIALVLIEAATTVGLDDIDIIINTLHKYCDNDCSLSIVWNVNFTERLKDASMRISMIYGKKR